MLSPLYQFTDKFLNSNTVKNSMLYQQLFYFILQRENIWTVPNLLCMSRICLSPMLGYFIVHAQYDYALVFVIVAGITDGVSPHSYRPVKIMYLHNPDLVT